MSTEKIFSIFGKNEKIFPQDVDQYGYISKLDIKLTEIGYLLYKGFHTQFTISKTDDQEYTLIPSPCKKRKVVKYAKKLLASGTYGSVYSFPLENIILKTDNKGDFLDSTLLSEISIYRYLDNKEYFPELYNFNFFRNKVEIYLEKGAKNLHQYMYKNPEISLKDIQNITLNIAKAIHYCSEKGIYHGDVKPENIIFSEKWKLIDFGLSSFDIRSSPRLKCPFIQSWGYRAPEIISEKGFYNEKIDVFSLGIIIFEMVVDKKRYKQPETEESSLLFLLHLYGYKNYTIGEDNKTLFYNGKEILERYCTEFSNIYEKNGTQSNKDILLKNIQSYGISDKSILDLISSMLEMSPKNRLTISEVLSHPFFQENNLQRYPSRKFEIVKSIYPYWENFGGSEKRTEIFKWLLRINFRFVACPETVENSFMLLDKSVLNGYKSENIYNTAFAIYILCLSIYESHKNDKFKRIVEYSGDAFKRTEIECELIKVFTFFRGDIIFPTYYGLLKKYRVKPNYPYKSLGHYMGNNVYEKDFKTEIENMIEHNLLISE